jgi:hypothetical protein
VLLIEFLNRISFFSILTWGFFYIAVLCAITLTAFRSPKIRRYRQSLIAIATSSILLGTISWSVPFFMSRLNPDQSRLTAIESLTPTEWIEPVSNPETELQEDEIAWTKQLPYKFKYKLKFNYEFKKALAVESSNIVLLDTSGNIHGFNSYTGLNHWVIALHTHQVLGQVQNQKKLYIVDHTSLDSLRISSIDLQNPSLLWQRNIPNSKEGSIHFDIETQSVIVSTGTNGVWSLTAKTGEVLWKRPEIFSRARVITSSKHVLVFEPMIAKKPGAWYFLDPQTGKTIKKVPHVYPDIKEFLPDELELMSPLYVLGKIDSENLMYMNHQDLSQLWSFHTPEPIKLTRFLNGSEYFLLYDSNLLELRNLSDNQLRWQKKLSPVEARFLKVSPDHHYFTLPVVAKDELAGVSFFQVDTGEYRVEAQTSEPVLDLLYYGDWIYLFSEGHLWALKK